MLEKDFSYFLFTSDSTMNAVLTMATFVVLGCLMSGVGGLRGLVQGAGQSLGDAAGGIAGHLINLLEVETLHSAALFLLEE